jgi:beta-glucosidase
MLAHVAGAGWCGSAFAILPAGHDAPDKDLCEFAKLDLQPGQSQTVSFDLSQYAFAHWDQALHNWGVSWGA